MADSRQPTHNAFAIKREGKKFFRWLEIGQARREERSGIIHAFLDRTPIGGFNGYVYLSPLGIEPEPQRPGEDEEMSST